MASIRFQWINRMFHHGTPFVNVTMIVTYAPIIVNWIDADCHITRIFYFTPILKIPKYPCESITYAITWIAGTHLAISPLQGKQTTGEMK
tara:strand:+ start:7933 stop:8202 length:270 start_codon:yes stop_codon:yes gene_type:complete